MSARPLRNIVRVLTLIIIAYLLLVLVVMIFQRRLVFIPERIPADAIPQLAKEHGFQPWTNQDGRIIGWKIPSAGASIGSVMIVHGNAGSAVTRDYLARPIHEAEPVDVYVLEYPGYGARAGSPSKRSMDAAAEEAFQLLSTNQPRYLVSESLGTGVAADLAANHPEAIAGINRMSCNSNNNSSNNSSNNNNTINSIINRRSSQHRHRIFYSVVVAEAATMAVVHVRLVYRNRI